MAASNIRVLIVEDDLLFAEQMKLDLESLGYTVIDIVDNATKALHLAKIANPEIILMDIDIKGKMDGIRTAQEIYAMNPVPIIFVTALTDRETFERAKMAHPYAYILKPSNKVAISNALELSIENFNRSKDGEIKPLEQFPFLKNNLLIRKGSKLVKLHFDTIDVIEVEEKYCTIYSGTEKYLARISLKEIQDRLSGDKFVRIHRNYLININVLSSIDLENNMVRAFDRDLPLGRKYRYELIKAHGYLS